MKQLQKLQIQILHPWKITILSCMKFPCIQESHQRYILHNLKLFTFIKQKSTQTPNIYLLEFEQRKARFVNILLEQYAKPSTDICATCTNAPAAFRCRTCQSPEFLCQGCIRDGHWHHPYHRIERWNGAFFQKVGLAQVGLRLVVRSRASCACIASRLGVIRAAERECDARQNASIHRRSEQSIGTPPNHSSDNPLTGEPATNAGESSAGPSNQLDNTGREDEFPDLDEDVAPEIEQHAEGDEERSEDEWDDEDSADHIGRGVPRSDEMGNKYVTILDLSGIHHLPLLVCQCAHDSDAQVEDCVAEGLFPSSFSQISTVFTKACLEEVRLLNLAAKTTPYQYHQYLQRITNKSFPGAVPNRYCELLCMSRHSLSC